MQKTNLFLLLKNRHRRKNSGSLKARTVVQPLWVGLFSVVLIGLAGLALFAGLYYARVASNLPSLDVLPVLLNPEDGELLEPSVLMDRENKTILYTFDNPGIERKYLKIDPEAKAHFNPQIIRAVVAKLEPNFWENPGYSWNDLNDPQPLTIAEHLVDDLLLWDEPQSDLRPLRMRILASQVVAKYGRTQVLEWYLNSVYFGHLAFGAESAAQLYFNKSAQDLSLAEAASLAVLIESPALNPLEAPLTTLELQREFLAEMANQQIISTQEFSTAIRQELAFRKKIDDPVSRAPAFTRHLIQQLQSSFGNNRLERGGLVIQSTLDLELQQQFVCTAQAQMMRLQYSSSTYYSEESDCQGALLLPTQLFSSIDTEKTATGGLVMDPRTGEVLVYMEPTTYEEETKVDSGYEPGSLISPFAALAAFARGLSPASLKWDVPSTSAELGGATNPDGSYHGPVSLRTAIANEYLVPVAEVIEQVGTSNVWNLAYAMGLTSIKDAPNSITPLFEGQPTSLLEIGTAYSTLANSGIRAGKINTKTTEIEPNLVISVKTATNRTLLENTSPDTSAILSSQLTFLMNNILSDESARWESLGFPNALEIGKPVGAKVGQTADKRQVWTVGYTPERLTLVWMGQPDLENSASLDPRMAAGVWHAVMKLATRNFANSGWIKPEGITQVRVCIPSGMLPSKDCPNIKEEVFLTGNEPTIPDNLYQTIRVNRETGQRATVFTDPALIEDQIFVDVPANARQWAMDAGLAVAPTGYDSISTISNNPNVSIDAPALFSQVSGKVVISGTTTINNFATYMVQIGEGINPTTWQQIGESGMTPVSKGELVVWDTTGLNGLYAIRLNVIDTNQGIEMAVIQVTVDNTPPQVRIGYPANDQTVESVRGSVTLSAEIQDEVSMQKVEWWLDGKLVATQTSAPYLHIMDADKGKHTLQILAWDTAGNKTSSEKIQFTIKQ